MITPSSAFATSNRARRGIAAITQHEFGWLERHLADDFMFTAHPIPGLRLHKRDFIEADKKIKSAEVRFVSIHAEAAGDILVSRTIADVKEEFGADLGPGMPSAAEITQMVSGQLPRGLCETRV